MTTTTRTYVDASRPTVDPHGTHSAPQRTIDTVVRVPDGEGPFPLVVFAHGDSGHPRKVTRLLDAWARAGYVVAAPAFPLTNDDVNPTVLADFTEQPADLHFVISSVLDDARADGPFAGKVDANRIGVAGHSLGGASTYGLVANSCCRDRRVRALVAMSTLRIDFPGGTWDKADVPLLAIHGTSDPVLHIELGRSAYKEWAGPKSFLTLVGALHSPYEDPANRWKDLIIEATTLFWDAHLSGDRAAADRLARLSPPPDLATYEP